MSTNINPVSLEIDGARDSSDLPVGFDYGDIANARALKLSCSREAGRAGTDDDD